MALISHPQSIRFLFIKMWCYTYIRERVTKSLRLVCALCTVCVFVIFVIVIRQYVCTNIARSQIFFLTQSLLPLRFPPSLYVIFWTAVDNNSLLFIILSCVWFFCFALERYTEFHTLWIYAEKFYMCIHILDVGIFFLARYRVYAVHILKICVHTFQCYAVVLLQMITGSSCFFIHNRFWASPFSIDLKSFIKKLRFTVNERTTRLQK